MNPLNFPREVTFSNARAFINALRLSSEKWTASTEWKSRWIFRGQRDASWPLLPKAWRAPITDRTQCEEIDFIQHYKDFNATVRNLEFQRILTLWPDGEPKQPQRQNMYDLLSQVSAELRSLADFIQIADEVGHEIDRIDPDAVVKSYLYDFRSIYGNDHDKLWMKDIIALAQHHGIPTRLLDWTSKPLVAAFFAADNVTYDVSSTESKLAVYALDTLMTGNRIQIHRVPRNKNAYLHAQSGLFTYDTLADSWYIEHGSWPSLESAMFEEAKLSRGPEMTDKDFDDYLSGLLKFTLPVSQAGELLQMLWVEGISRAHLMPTLDNVALALKKKIYWEEKQNPNLMRRTKR